LNKNAIVRKIMGVKEVIPHQTNSRQPLTPNNPHSRRERGIFEHFVRVCACASINLTKREEIRVHLRRSIDTIHRFPDIEKIDKIEKYAHRLHSRILVCVEEVEGG